MPLRHVELRRDRLAGLPDLELVRVPAGVGGRPRRADRGAEDVGERLDEPKFSALPTPRPPETTIDASVSSGRPARSAGDPLGDARAAGPASDSVDGDVDALAGRRRPARARWSSAGP